MLFILAPGVYFYRTLLAASPLAHDSPLMPHERTACGGGRAPLPYKPALVVTVG